MDRVKKKELDFGNDKIFSILLRLAPPVMLAQLIQALYNIIDSFFIGNYSESGLTALSIIYPIQLLMIALAVGTGVGINTLMAHFLGVDNKEKRDETAGVGKFLAFAMWFVFALICWLIMPFYAQISTNSQEIIDEVIVYGRIVCVFSFGLFFESIWTKVMQATGNMKIPMIAQIAGAFVNIALDPLLIFGIGFFPELGIAGAAIATVVGQIIAMLLGLYFNLTKNTDVQFNFKSIELESYYFKGICTVGIPTIIMQSMSSIMCFGINKLLLNFSTTSTAVFGAYFKLQTFVYMATFGLNNVLIPIVAFNLGAKHADRIKKVIRLSGAYSALIGLVGLIIMEMLPVQLISAFAPSEEMFSLGVTALRILGFSFVFGGVSVMTCYALQGFSRGISSLIISALRQVIILLPLASILGKAIGINGIWWSFLISETVTVTRNVRHRFQSSNSQK